MLDTWNEYKIISNVKKNLILLIFKERKLKKKEAFCELFILPGTASPIFLENL